MSGQETEVAQVVGATAEGEEELPAKLAIVDLVLGGSVRLGEPHNFEPGEGERRSVDYVVGQSKPAAGNRQSRGKRDGSLQANHRSVVRIAAAGRQYVRSSSKRCKFRDCFVIAILDGLIIALKPEAKCLSKGSSAAENEQSDNQQGLNFH